MAKIYNYYCLLYHAFNTVASTMLVVLHLEAAPTLSPCGFVLLQCLYAAHAIVMVTTCPTTSVVHHNVYPRHVLL